jgi:3-oxoacyl-[acyl-carrier-protein] synthase II
VNTPVACAASNTALAWAIDRIEAGQASCMLAGGFDVVGPTAVGGYQLFDNLTHSLPRPFDLERDGFLLGEGGAIFFLEPEESARAAGRRIVAIVRGAGCAHDAAHPTRPSPDGRGLRRALQKALREAGLSPAEIGYVNAHSPGTLANDAAEAAAYREVFGPRGVPVSSTKAALGHAQGGANSLEMVACIFALERQELPPTLNLASPDPELQLDLIAGGPRPTRIAHAVNSACSLGGASAVVVVSRSGS